MQRQHMAITSDLQGVPEQIAQSLSTTILQSYTTELCCLWQNVQKENAYKTKASV